MKAVIQAGGKGTRLHPYTFVLPKPMMPVGDQPVIEVLLKWLRRWGVTEAYITTGYLGDLIRALCGNGHQWSMDIKYSRETEPLGTIGALNLLREELTETFLVLNGDVITDLDINAFIEYHKTRGGPVTIATTEKAVNCDLGVIDDDGGRVTNFREKPTTTFRVSMGIYCMEPSVFGLIPKGVPFGFDTLMYAMHRQQWPAYVYRHLGLWIDIGQEKDLCRTQELFQKNYKSLLLGA